MILTAAHASREAPLDGHLWHIVGSLAFFILTIGGIALSESVKGRAADRSVGSDRSSLLTVMALAGCGAAAVHFVVMPTHFHEATLYGVFFAVAASTQLSYSVLLLVRPSRVLVGAGVAGNLAMVALWLVTRTIEIPFGPAAGTVESFGGLDVLASGFEALIVIAGVVALLRIQIPSRSLARGLLNPAAWVFTAMIAVSVALTASLSPPS